MTKTEQVSVIQAAYRALSQLGLYEGFHDVAERLYDMNKEAELRHRRGAPNGIRHGLSVKDAAKLFTVSHLLDGYRQPNKWTVDDILAIRLEVLYAQAYAKRYYAELTGWVLQYGPQFEGVDYSELMKVAA